MDVKNIVVLNNASLNKEDIIVDLKNEGYRHNFCFASWVDTHYGASAIEHADEVWTFGDCTDTFLYRHAMEVGADIWNMG